MHTKDAEGIANSVDSDQTRSSLIWVCIVCPDLSVWKLRNIMVDWLTELWFNVPVNHSPEAHEPSSNLAISFRKSSINCNEKKGFCLIKTSQSCTQWGANAECTLLWDLAKPCNFSSETEFTPPNKNKFFHAIQFSNISWILMRLLWRHSGHLI